MSDRPDMVFGSVPKIRGMRKTVAPRGFKISYRTAGAGRPLLLLHGWSQHADEWWDCGYVDSLVDSYRIVAIDRLGHGQSDKPHDPEHYEENRIVSDIIAVLDAEQIDRALVWGYSMGARNACSLAAMEPSRVGAVVAGGFALLPGTDARRDNFVALGKTASTVEGLEGALRMLGADDDFIRPSLERNDTAALSACLVGFARYFPAASDVNCPSLWYSGTDDVALKAARHEVMDLAKQLHVETRDVPDASHVGAFLCSGEVLAFVKPFLDTASE